MQSKQDKSIVAVTISLTLFILLIIGYRNANAEESYQTWPSRTPTPQPAATQPPGEPTLAAPAATATIPSTPVSTGTSEMIASPTIEQQPEESTGTPKASEPSTNVGTEGEISDSQARCDVPPTVQALDDLSVHAGPGSNHQVIGQLGIDESRIILGRAATEPWWLIQFNAETRGWVIDSDVVVNGYIGVIPIVIEDGLNSGEQASWDPTPDPACAPPDFVVAEEESESTLSSTGSDEIDSQRTSSQESTQDNGELGLNEEPPDGTDTVPKGSDANSDRRVGGQTSFTWLLITGTFLILAGSVAFIVRRQK